MAAAASSAAPTVSVLRRRTRKRGFAVSRFPRYFLKTNCKNIRISSPFCFGRGYAALFFFIPGGAPCASRDRPVVRRPRTDFRQTLLFSLRKSRACVTLDTVIIENETRGPSPHTENSIVFGGEKSWRSEKKRRIPRCQWPLRAVSTPPPPPQLETELKADLDGVTELRLDFGQVEYISSAGLRVLLSAQKLMNRQGKMVLTHVSESVMEIFEVTGFSDILTIE